MKERILSLLGSGINPALVSSAVGCDPSYVSQLMKEDSFALEVATLRCKDLEIAIERDGRYDKLEDKLLERLELLLPLMMKPRDVLGALQVINNAKRRSVEMQKGGGTTNITQNIVYLQLPEKTVSTFSLSKHNEVIEVAGKSLAPMSTETLMKSLAAANQQGVLEHESNKDSRSTPPRDATNQYLPEKISSRITTSDSV